MALKTVPKSVIVTVSRYFGTVVTGSPASVTQRYPPSCIKKTEVQIFGSVWQKYKSLGYKRYFDAPEHGILTPASYFDTGDVIRGSSSSYVPTAVLIHGSPGSVDHFSSLVDSMTEKGIRVICPSLLHPDFTFNVCKYYRHSAAEKAEYIKAILQVSYLYHLYCILTTFSGRRSQEDRLPGISFFRNLCQHGTESGSSRP